MSRTTHHSHTLQIRQALWDLQKEVLTSLKDSFDQEVGYQAQPAEWFHVLTTAERYVWLRELTSLMADIDVLTELDSVSEEQAAIARCEIERLLFDLESDGTFNKNYKALLLAAGTLLPPHSHLKSQLSLVEKRADISKEIALAERKSWQEIHREQSRKKRN